MSFSEYKGVKSKEDLQVELSVLENSLEGDMSAGDKKVLEKSIIKLKGRIELIEDTISTDIANVEQNLFSKCSDKKDCNCSKCQVLRRKDISEALESKSPFGNFFS